MPSKISWQDRANILLDKYALNSAGSLTKSSLAEELGISRQTLWRNNAIRAKINLILDKPTVKKRSSKDARIQDLERRVRVLNHENGLLIQSFLLVCKRLRENGLDPELYVSESASEIEAAFPNWPASRIFAEA